MRRKKETGSGAWGKLAFLNGWGEFLGGLVVVVVIQSEKG